jgi:hypothetical protein
MSWGLSWCQGVAFKYFHQFTRLFLVCLLLAESSGKPTRPSRMPLVWINDNASK